ncbi:MAG TPA: AI-2E family transporter, partial [Devosia sp.]|nr:AI-2E family transporter [Devosia sp.]
MKPNEQPSEPRWLGTASPNRVALIAPISVARWLLVLVLAAGVYFFHGFLVPVLAALVIGFASWPIYSDILRRCGGNRPLAATIAILLILAFLIVPLVMAVSYTITEVGVWFNWAVETNRTGSETPGWMATLPGVGQWVDEQWYRYIGHPGAIGELVQIVSGANIGSIYRGVLAAGGSAFGLLLTMLFMLIALFFAYRDGEAFAGQIDRL